MFTLAASVVPAIFDPGPGSALHPGTLYADNISMGIPRGKGCRQLA